MDTQSLLQPRPVDKAKEALAEKFYQDSFYKLDPDCWRENNWSLNQAALANLQNDKRNDPTLLSNMENNYALLRGLSAQRPVTILEDFFPTHLGENNPKLWDGGRFVYNENQTRGINFNDIRLFHTLETEDERQKYIQERVLPASEHAGEAYGFWGGATGFTTGMLATLLLNSKRLGVPYGTAIGIGAVALLTYAGAKAGNHYGRQFILSDYVELQKRADQLRDQLK